MSDLGLFLFNDVLVLTRRTVRHLAFTRVQRSTHTFQAAVALDRLAVRELAHTRCESRRRGHHRPHTHTQLRHAASVSLRRRESRLRPGGSRSVLDLHHGAKGGHGGLPDGPAGRHQLRTEARSLRGWLRGGGLGGWLRSFTRVQFVVTLDRKTDESSNFCCSAII